jgi:hypothetical protein
MMALRNPAVLEDSSQQHQQQQRCRVADNSSPLDKDDIVDAVFSYVGIGDFIFTGAVSRRWKERYTKLCSSAPEECRMCTALSSAVTTAARLQHAADNGLAMKNLCIHFFAETVVMYSLEPGRILPHRDESLSNWQHLLWNYAVDHNKLQLLQLMHSSGFDARHFITASAHTAAENDYVAMLSWLYNISDAAVWTDKLMQSVFYDAGRWASFDSLEWLRGKGMKMVLSKSAK